jgi:dihydroorotase
VPPATRQIRLTRGGAKVEESLRGEGVEVVPFRAGEETWGVEWL